MERIKLEYLLKRLKIEDLKEYYYLIDVRGIFTFDEYVCEILGNPECKNTIILSRFSWDKNDRQFACCIKYYKDLFKHLNKLCTRNNTYPLFPHPKNLVECIKIREDLVKEVPEEELNAFYGVAKFQDYIPEEYIPPKK